MNSKKQIRLDMLIVFLIALLPRLLLIFLYAEPFRTPMDEMSTISTAAYFGGKDWTALTTSANFYYGGGFTILFAPLFRLISNPYVLYYIMLSVCAVLQSISAPISYTIMRKYLRVEKRQYVLIGSVACSYFVVSRSMEVFNEHIIIACIWIVAWLLCRLILNEGDYRKKSIDSVAIMFILSYMLTTHTRTKVMWFAFAIVIVLYYWIYKKWLVTVIPTVIAGVIGYVGAQKFIEMVKVAIWKWQEGDYLKNASVKLELSISDFKNLTSWQGIGSIIIGQTNTLLIFSGGILAIIIVMLVKLYWSTIVTRVRRGEQEEIGQAANIRSIILVVSTMFILCAGAVMAAQSLTWLHRIVAALTDQPYDSNAYGYKAITYMRYCGPFVAPILMVGIVYIYHKRETLRQYIFPTLTLSAVLQAVWIFFIFPHIGKSRTASEVFVAFGGFEICEDPGMRYRVYLLGSVVLLILLIISMICYLKKQILVPLLLVTLLLGYEYAYGAIKWDGAWAEKYSANIDAGAEVLLEISEDEDDGAFLPQEIYMYDKSDSTQKPVYILQMMLNEHTILPELPQENATEAIVVCREQNQTLIDRGYHEATLDDKVLIYVLGDKYTTMMKKYGIIFDK